MHTGSTFEFGTRSVGEGCPVLVIAEIGINHEGDAGACAEMISAAAEAGADAVKLQTIEPESNYAPGTISYELFKRAELTPEETASMFALARKAGVEPFTTAGDIRTLEWLRELEPAGYKISSGLLTCTPVIEFAASLGRPLLMSTGMATVEDIDAAIGVARGAKGCDVALLQCTSVYPAELHQLNLGSITWLQHNYDVVTGFSDHSCGVDAAVHAVSAGAQIVEKHFTLDSSRPEFDHRLSLEPDQFAEMVSGIRAATLMRGVPGKPLLPEAQTMRRNMSRYLGALRNLRKGDVVGTDTVGFFRFTPGTEGITAAQFEGLNGRVIKRDVHASTPLQLEDIDES